MLGALLYLRLTSLKNLIVSRAKRLRQPKYLAGALAGAAYFYFIFFRQITGGVTGQGTKRAAAKQAAAALPLPASFADTLPLVTALGALLLLVIVLLAWVLPSDKPGLRFTEAEAAFLFPAPVTRRTLVNFKLLSSQFSILFTSLFFTLISNRWSFLGGNALMHAFGWWFVLSTLNLHFTGAALTISRLVDGGVSPLRRRLFVFGLVVVTLTATFAWVWRDIDGPDPADVTGFAPFTHYVLGVLDHGVLGVLLIPFKFVLGPFLAPDSRSFLLALAPALLVIAAHYRWVLSMETSFEEASLALAEKRAAVLHAVREGKHPLLRARTAGRPDPFFLADTGRPDVAFLWKNLLSTAPYFNLRVFAVAAAVIIVGSRWFLGSDPGDQAVRFVVITVSSMAGVYILVFGPHLARQDLRGDLQNSDLLKTYPLPGWQLLLGELLTPITILTGLVWLMLLAASLAFSPPGRLELTFTPGVRLALSLSIAALVPFLCALQLLVVNGATLIFPAWFQATRTHGGGGIELMGQRLIFFVGQLCMMLIALLPAAIAGGAAFGLVWFAFQLSGHAPLATVPGILTTAVVSLLVIGGEVAGALWWLGERFERLDVSSELRP
jgi:hypothetical protein